MLIAAAAVLFGLVPGSYIVLSIEGVRRSARSLVSALPAIAQLLAGPALLLFIVVAYAASSGLAVVPRLVAYAPYLLVPPLLLARPLRTSDATQQAPLRELAIVFALWLPIEFRMLPPLPLPAPNGTDLQKLVGLVEAMYLFLVVRPLPGIGYTYRLSFGLAHLPDPRYVLLAAIAGVAYGWVYFRTQRITASAITHALVDATWAALLRG